MFTLTRECIAINIGYSYFINNIFPFSSQIGVVANFCTLNFASIKIKIVFCRETFKLKFVLKLFRVHLMMPSKLYEKIHLATSIFLLSVINSMSNKNSDSNLNG